MAEQLNAENIPTATGGKWSVKTVRDQALRGAARPVALTDVRTPVSVERLEVAS